MNKAIKIVIGLILILAGAYSYFYEFFREQLIELIKLSIGNLGLLAMFIGLMFIVVAFFE